MTPRALTYRLYIFPHPLLPSTPRLSSIINRRLPLPPKSHIELTAEHHSWQHRTNKMCYNEIEKFGCGHEEKHRIPCEDLCENRGCTKTEEDQIREDTGSVCTKCRNDEDETEFIQEELRKFAEQESLNPSAPPPTRTRDPNAPKLFFKRCIVWTKCHREYCL